MNTERTPWHIDDETLGRLRRRHHLTRAGDVRRDAPALLP